MKLTYVKRGQYWYKVRDDKHPRERRICYCGKRFFGRRDKPGFYCSKHCAQMGEHNTVWKGDETGYIAAHGRVYRARGKATTCVFDESHPGPYDWANLMGDYPDVADYTQMCRACHAAFDGAQSKCLEKTCKRGHVLNDKTMYKRTRGGKEARQCKQCAKDRAAERRQSM